ncbi:MAG: lipopolysaccharide kinase InaA family protein [Planctomycetota bacterium]|jgi:tRNA A-37 threonylcarbamoyl transferase component Bud32
MADFPLQLSIKKIWPGSNTEPVTCNGLLRAVPGNREVYDAFWNDREVIVKVFSNKIRAKRHLKREWKGLLMLQERGVNAPTPLFYGQTENGQWAVVLEKITNASIALDLFNEIQKPAEKLDLLIPICKELAGQHKKAVIQKDLHLGNFLLVKNRVFSLDPGQIKFLLKPISRKKSLSQLASLARYLSENDTEAIRKLCEEYAGARNWSFEKSDELLFRKQLSAHEKRIIRRGLKKCLRTSKRHVRIKKGPLTGIFERAFCKETEMLDFMEQADALMDKGKILKNGNTCYVSRVGWAGKDVVVKKYKHKGFIHSLRQTIKRSRARRGWLNGHLLGMLNIATPRPLAYLEKRKWLLVWKSYLVTEYVEGQRLYDFLRDTNVTEQQRSTVTTRAEELLAKLEKHKISHGDLKHSNILVTDADPALTDLDAMKVHRLGWIFRLYRKKDHARFTKFLPKK